MLEPQEQKVETASPRSGSGEGQTLRQRLAALPDRRLPVAEFLELALQCAEAVQSAHARGVIHGDIKPENIVLTGSGAGRRQANVIVSGAAPRLDDPAYMAPEALLHRQVDGRSDLFSLGVVFYEALSGQQPFRAATLVATCDRVLRFQPADITAVNPEVPPAVAGILARLLAKDAASRFASAAELAAALEALRTVPEPATPRRRLWFAAVAALVLLAAVLAYVASRTRGGSQDLPVDKHVVVLPFINLGGDPRQKVLCDGLAHVLSSRLTEVEELRDSLVVVPPIEAIRESADTADKARRILGANLALSGSVRRVGDEVSISASVVDTRSLRQLRSATVQGQADAWSLLQDALTMQIAGLLGATQPDSAGTATAGNAGELYLQGRGYLFDQGNAENLDAAIRALQGAVKVEPDFAPAHVALGEAYWQQYQRDKAPQHAEQAAAACQDAVRLGGALAEGLVCLGTVAAGTGKNAEAVTHFQRAIAVSDRNDDAYRGLAAAYESLGQFSEAEATYQRAIGVRPRYWAGYERLGAFYASRARYDEAAKMFSEVIRLAPDTVRGYSSLGATYIYMERLNDAAAMLRKSLAIRPTAGAHTSLGRAYLGMREYDPAAIQFREAVRLQPRDYLHWGNLAIASYYSRGRRSEAGQAFRKALELAGARPADAVVLARMAAYHAMLNERDLAMELLRQAAHSGPETPESLALAAEVHAQLRDYGTAKQYLDRATAAGWPAALVRESPQLDALRRRPEFAATAQSEAR